MEKEIIGYRCVDNTGGEQFFTLGKIYHINDGCKLNDFEAFIDDVGDPNGWAWNNYRHFEPVYVVVNPQNLALTSYLSYNLGIDFEMLKESKSHLIKLLALDGNLGNNYILELIDSIQDYAVDNHNLPRNQVFNVDEEFGI